MCSFVLRSAVHADSPHCMELIGQAKRYMASLGRHQWDEHYPAVTDIEADISQGNACVLCIDGTVVAYGAVIFTGEALYGSIDGRWLSDGPYVVLHRLCVADEVRGRGVAQRYFAEVERLALEHGVHSFKVDTNFDNADMLHILEKCGFAYCGKIRYPHGERMAFEKLL